ncbi:calsequestrin-2-like [Rhodamnia argentea]|uniref:Calsequestrin-2-like n=1 Tax=Rhodamnia argentea TaxID=178133 RepID=A0A8B8NM05_9MYRT|nr:calsequestrin-2-like [Rhodamnia argentea]XP_048128685.1 calsequestrin-2-like [Rhodamnia argentea]XP_048128686.1 calsequestrin-2-like [Rhodamnia argentea]
MEMKMGSLSYFEEELDFGFFHVESEVEDTISAHWELVNASDSDSDLSDSDAPDSPVLDGSVDNLSLQSGVARIDDLDARGGSSRDGDSLVSCPIPLPETLEFRADNYIVKANVGGDWRRDDPDDDGDDDEEEEIDDDGLDDELVPRHLSGKFGRQRIRKLGKRACSKMNYSKRSPHLFVKPGCLHGKHGLGLKHSL